MILPPRLPKWSLFNTHLSSLISSTFRQVSRPPPHVVDEAAEYHAISICQPPRRVCDQGQGVIINGAWSIGPPLATSAGVPAELSAAIHGPTPAPLS